ncbi:hypothetical protein TGAMA5MH_10013 [Trichoderma gamsii]|uniref:Uncharacterized protein n=1 Tax=Trichoderma gamsii TaxID=398673 RepID=A0A2K0SXC9_9HYPO|nr:hypothetical protein TGAMA5MH_10013 [Trichoderma gamsii]
MFKRSRRRDHSLQPPLTKETAAPDAAMAAASAYMRGNNSPAPSLSSAAAAAALRAQPAPLTNVAEAPSKRVQRRASSLSSPIGGRDRGKTSKLSRTPSVSSMTERTFRSPSPGRAASTKKQDVPPVPSMPASKNITTQLKTQNFRTASQKSKGHPQGAWFGAAVIQNEQMPESIPKSSPDLPESRSGSVSSSINFSYPRRMPSYDSNLPAEHELVYDPNSRRMVPKAAAMTASRQAEDVVLKSSEKAKGTKPVKKGQATQEWVNEMNIPPPNHIRTESPLLASNQSNDADYFEKSNPDDISGSSRLITAAVEKPSPMREIGNKASNDFQLQKDLHNEPLEILASAKTSASVSPSLSKYDNFKVEAPFSYAGSSSETSVRSAHFASSADRLAVVKHEPPPRSLSPRKSAMKSSISSRGSLSQNPNEILEYSGLGISHLSGEDAAAGQKRGARVSWNDNSTVMAIEPSKFEEADTTAASNSHSRQKAYNAVDGQRTTTESTLQEDELMSPRPALPLFGSVRDKKGKEPEERQLVRPRERSLSPQSMPPSTSHASSFAPKNENIPSVEPVKGLNFNRDQGPRNVANISKYREPLPSIMASTESLGYEGEETDSSDDERFEDVLTGADESTSHPPSRDLLPDPSSTSSGNEAYKASSATIGGLPGNFNETPFSPPEMQYDGVVPMARSNSLPGSFPPEDNIPKFSSDDANGSAAPMLTQASGSKVVKLTQLIGENKIEEESDKDSIYSDAYEDQPEAAEDGFMSIDAALANPLFSQSGNNKLNLNANHESKLPNDDADADDWERTKAYWKSLSSDERRRLEIEALQEADDDILHGGLAAKSSAALPNASGYSPEAKQKKQIHQSQVEGPLPADLAPSSRATQDHSDPLRQIDAHTGRRSLQPPEATKTSNTATGRGFKKLAKLKRSLSSEPRHADDSRGSVARPSSLYSPVISTGSGPKHGSRNPETPAEQPATNPAMNASMKSSLRRRGSDSSESSFVRSRSASDTRHGFRASMRSNMAESKLSMGSTRAGKRMTLRSLSPSASHAQRHSVAPTSYSETVTVHQGNRSFHQSAAAPQTNRSFPKRYEDSAYEDHLSDSSDDDLNTTPLTNRSLTGDEYEPAHSKLKKRSFSHLYARNKTPDHNHNPNPNAGIVSSSQKSNKLKRRDDQYHNEGETHMPQRPVSQPISAAAAQEASSRRPGLISSFMRKKDHRETHELHHNTEDAHSSGWPLQNRRAMPNELPMTSPTEDGGRRSAASGSIGLTSDPRQQHELRGSSDPGQVEHKRKKFNSLRKMFKIND